jgi:hypothetical protein
MESRSRYNRMTWGVMLHDILPSKGAKCAYRQNCQYVRTRRGKCECRSEDRCPAESSLYRWIVTTTRRSYEHRRAVLGDAVFEQTVHDFAILWLRKERLSARIGIEGFLRERLDQYGRATQEFTLAFGRYQTAIERQSVSVFGNLVDVS